MIPRITTATPPPIRVAGRRHVPTRYRVRIGRSWFRVYIEAGSEYVIVRGQVTPL